MEPITAAGRHSLGITVQGVLNDTLSNLLGEKIETIGAAVQMLVCTLWEM